MYKILESTALGLLFGTSLSAALLSCDAKSEELSGINSVSGAYCALYARESVLIDAIHGSPPGIDTKEIIDRAKEHYGDCIAILPTLLPLPSGEGSLQTWATDIRDILFMRAKEHVANIGVVPAKEKPENGIIDGQESWRIQCRAEYRSWDEATGTVIRRGSSSRVRCPCGGDVTCE